MSDEVTTPAAEEPVETTAPETTADTNVETSEPEAPAATAADGAPKAEEPKASARTLLEDEDESAPAQAEQTQPAADAETIDNFCKGIDATDLGDGVTWSDDTLKAMAPSLIELTGGDPKKANGVVKAYAGYVQEQARRQQEAAEAFNNGLIQECQKRFGADIRKVAKLAREGGRAIFGDDLWSALKATPAFANNPDVLERLASYGRRLIEDGGAVKPTDGTPTQADADVLHRMYGNVKVG